MICKNCGAEFEDLLPKCPYCAELNEIGAQKEYMAKLDAMKDHLDALHTTIPKMYAEEFKKQTRHTRKLILGTAAVFALLFVILYRLNSFSEEDSKEVLLFTKRAFPIADEYYETGDFEGLLDFYHTSTAENPNASFYHWKHFDFLLCYESYTSFMECAAEFAQGTFSDYELSEVIFHYGSAIYHSNNTLLSEADQQLIFALTEEMQSVLSTLPFTETEVLELQEAFRSDEFPSWDDIQALSKKIYKRIQKEKDS